MTHVQSTAAAKAAHALEVGRPKPSLATVVAVIELDDATHDKSEGKVADAR